MHKKPGIAVARTLALSASLLGLLLALALPTTPSALAAGDVNQGSCPNEANAGFSAELPDCRAYEQVSPAFKNGFGATFHYLSPDGEQVQWESPGTFAGAVGSEECAINEFRTERGAGGWATTAINDAPLTEFAPASKGCTKHLVNEAGESLVELRPSSGSIYAFDLYRHEPDGGPFVLVGPMIPRSAVPSSPTGPGEAGGFQCGCDFVDATPDLEHVLFTLEAQDKELAPGVKTELWLGDTTALSPEAYYTPSLYEYVGTNNTTPTLVGVDNSGRLISDCGTTAGGWDNGGSGNHLNVISEDGARVFFTAVGHHPGCAAEVAPPVFELYARLNSGQAQSPVEAHGRCTVAADACTVAISEPGAGAGCTGTCALNASSEADFRDANYEKASRDGSKVFFTSTQQLLNGATQDTESNDSAVPQGRRKGCDATPIVSSGTTGPDGCNLYEYDLEENPETKAPIGLSLLSGKDSSGLGPEVQGVAAVSEDGSHVYFLAKGVLTTTPNEYGAGAIAGENNLYVNDTTTGRTTFIATLAESDDEQWTFDAGGLFGHPMDATDDGGYLVFTSSAHLVPGDNSTVQQVFRYDATTGELLRVSLGNEGHDGLGASIIPSRRAASTLENEALGGDSHPAVSEDGAAVVFSSSEALVPQAPTNNQCAKVEEGKCKSYIDNDYEYRDGHVYLIAGNTTEERPAISESGRDVMFVTHEPLLASDGDTVADIYDARSDGGFPAASGAVPCSDVCQGPLPVAPVFAAPGTASVSTGGNLAPPGLAVAPKPKAKPLTRVQKLANALHTCRQKRKQARTSCESAARGKYGSKAKKSRSDRRSGR